MVMFHSYVTYVSLPEGSNPKQLFVLKLIIEGNMLLLFETAQLRYFPKKKDTSNMSMVNGGAVLRP